MKKYILGFMLTAVVVCLVTFSSFRKSPGTSVVSSWYQYVGPSGQNTSNILNESNYQLVSAPSGCNSSNRICAILVPGQGEHPDEFDSSTESDILAAFNSKSPQAGYIEMKL